MGPRRRVTLLHVASRDHYNVIIIAYLSYFDQEMFLNVVIATSMIVVGTLVMIRSGTCKYVLMCCECKADFSTSRTYQGRR